eukprot:8902875-Alexandrium_andersonii.AAC.1
MPTRPEPPLDTALDDAPAAVSIGWWDGIDWDQLARIAAATVVQVPAAFKAAVTDLKHDILQQLQDAHYAGDFAMEERYWKLIGVIDVLLFARVPDGKMATVLGSRLELARS